MFSLNQGGEGDVRWETKWSCEVGKQQIKAVRTRALPSEINGICWGYLRFILNLPYMYNKFLSNESEKSKEGPFLLRQLRFTDRRTDDRTDIFIFSFSWNKASCTSWQQGICDWNSKALVWNSPPLFKRKIKFQGGGCSGRSLLQVIWKIHRYFNTKKMIISLESLIKKNPKINTRVVQKSST